MTTQKLNYTHTYGFFDWLETLIAKRNELVPAVTMTIETWYQRGKQRQQLARLTNEQLADIGVSREQADKEADKVFWEK